MTYTGGALNRLYGSSRASNPQESVHVMSLIREHDPADPDELYRLIEEHHTGDCDCGIESGGTIEDFGRWLYEAQHSAWGTTKFDLAECTQWIYDLFIVQSLKGHDIEREAKDLVAESFDITDVTDEADSEYHVDFAVQYDGTPVAGIQVKPESYKEVRDVVHDRADDAHDSIDEPVLFLYYDYDQGVFTNAESVLERLYGLVEGDDE